MDKRLITQDDVEKVAELSRLTIEGEEDDFTKLFEETLEYVQVLKELDTKDVKETYQVTGMVNVFQEDTDPVSCLTQEEALSNKENIKDGLFVTEGVFNE